MRDVGGDAARQAYEEQVRAAEELRAEFDRQAASVGALTTAIEEVRGQGSAAGGLITVTVNAGGRITALNLNPRAMRMASDELSAGILAAVDEGAADAARQVAELAGAVPQPGSATWDELISGEKSLDPTQALPPMLDEAAFEAAIEDRARRYLEGGV